MLQMYTQQYTLSLAMETLKVGIREFREKLASYLLETDVPVPIPRHGDTIGYYIPARRKRTHRMRSRAQSLPSSKYSYCGVAALRTSIEVQSRMP